ncbi:OsmC family protein [Allohahella sp. A8]|uniref:OsmC family protein n=1 Tax=Allohahella sp. A8 TaxID=3141461 RepID=UPI003A7FBC80
MTAHTAKIIWTRDGAKFTDNRYSRKHQWHFDGGLIVQASSSPHVVRVPLSDASAVDPEEAFVASLSSCHMLWFLSIVVSKGFVVDSYVDEATGVMAKNADGKLAMTEVTLRPCVVFSGTNQPSQSDINAMHHQAHTECFISSSVKSEVRCEPVFS